jgi:lipopolysaccharide transport system ATP-binding protein
MQSIITVENLGKQYRLGTQGAAYATLREAITNALRSRRDPGRENGNSSQQTIWALRDVSFEIQPGEVVGIIGRNGAGKSTLLKILSRVTEPTTGRVKLFGRVGSLLEVGTGFHPELTGRENVFLNGSILGMSRKEILRRFDEIVAFAEVEKFVDTPVKRFSSGMYLRLAFAVAAHLEPEILIVDEVLAVGDAAFQQRCLGRMREVATAGRTVLFVSHNMAAISALCSKAMVLSQGSIDFPIGDVRTAVDKYLSRVTEITHTELARRTDRQGEGRIRIVHFAVFDGDGNEQEYLSSGQEVDLRIYYECRENPRPKNVTVAIGISSLAGGFVALLSNQLTAEAFDQLPDRGVFSCRLPKLALAPGSYILNLIVRQNDVVQDWIQEAVNMTVEAGDFYGTGRMPPLSHGGVFFEQHWMANHPGSGAGQ